ncbi:FxLYD domain-containing protein [Candidatus Binatia bacterium]|jgi:hypothetical protein|nr:FxLYD domain-containing protein [Candidatus Binatia bacterium]
MSTRLRARRTPGVATSLVILLVVVTAHAALADTAPPAASSPKPTVTAAAAGAAPAADAIEIKEDGARWENGYGEKFFQVVGTVTNRSAAPVGAVRVRVELLDESGKVVATFDGWNARAEALGDLEGDAARAELGELAPGPIAPGASDRFRSTFLADETPPFTARRVRVITVLPPA